MTPEPILLIGAGGHASACIDVIEQEARYRIAGLVGTGAELNSIHLGYSVIGTDEELAGLFRSIPSALITVGQIQSPTLRMRLFEQVAGIGFQFPTIVAPTAYVSKHAQVGPGSIVMHGAVVNAGARVGKNCIVNSRALIEHDAVVGDHCHISTGAILNGNVCLGDGCFAGSSSVFRHGVQVGPNCVIGMGVVVRRDLAGYSTLKGDLLK